MVIILLDLYSVLDYHMKKRYKNMKDSTLSLTADVHYAVIIEDTFVP
jgi:hypothetical protein